MTLWQKKFYYLIENDYVCDPQIFSHESRNCYLYRIFRFTFHRVEFYIERYQKNQDCEYDRLYLFCNLRYFQRNALAGNYPKRIDLSYTNLLSFSG